jgi:hypothetical protein
MGETLQAYMAETAEEQEMLMLLDAELDIPANADPTPEVLPEDERCLTEVNHLLHSRRPDGSYAPEVLEHNVQNLHTAVQEAALKYAITETEHQATYVEEDGRRKRTFMWLGKTALQVAQSGYKFHHHPAAHERVDIEVDEAVHNDEAIRPGFVRVLVSPKMTEQDAPRAVAKKEHLADADAIRVTFPKTNEKDTVIARRMQSLLASDVPTEAWNAMFNDPSNLWQKSFNLSGSSALSIMRLHAELELPEEAVPEGPLTILKAVTPYIADPIARQKVQTHIGNFEATNQAEQETFSHNIAQRWQAFNRELVESIVADRATPAVEAFITSLQNEWTNADQQLFRQFRKTDDSLAMPLAVQKRLSAVQQNMLFSRAAIATGNADVLDQTDEQTATIIRENELQIQQMQSSGADVYDIMLLDAGNNSIVAQQNFTVGGGCIGENGAQFNKREGNSRDAESQNAEAATSAAQGGGKSGEDRSKWKWRKGTCRVETCATRPSKTAIGPCDVCKRCQRVFDKGGDPTKMNWMTRIDTSRINLVGNVLAIWKKQESDELPLAKNVLVDKHKQLAVH